MQGQRQQRLALGAGRVAAVAALAAEPGAGALGQTAPRSPAQAQAPNPPKTAQRKPWTQPTERAAQRHASPDARRDGAPQRAALLRLLVQPAHWVHPLHQQRQLGTTEPPDWGGSAGDNASDAARRPIWQRQVRGVAAGALQLPWRWTCKSGVGAGAAASAPWPGWRPGCARDCAIRCWPGGARALLCQRACQAQPSHTCSRGPSGKLQSELQSDPQRPYSASALSACCWRGAHWHPRAGLGRGFAPMRWRHLQLRLPPSASAQTPSQAHPQIRPPGPRSLPGAVHGRLHHAPQPGLTHL